MYLPLMFPHAILDECLMKSKSGALPQDERDRP
jgi:hypothetical protein